MQLEVLLFTLSFLSIFGMGALFLISLIILIILAIMKKRIKVVGILTIVFFVLTIASIVVAYITGPSFSVDYENETMLFEFAGETFEFDMNQDIQEQVDEFILEYQESLEEENAAPSDADNED